MRSAIFCLLALLHAMQVEAANYGFDFRGSHQAGWHATHDVQLTPADDGLRIAITGSDPYLMSPSFALPDGDRLVVKIRLKSETGGAGQLFYFTEHTLEKDSVRFGVPAGDWQDVWVTIPPSSPHVRFRLDPPGTSGNCIVESIEVQPGLSHSWPSWTEQPPLDLNDSFLLRSGNIALAHSKT
ncbi:MAG: hypothetical protein ACK528_14175, partial [Alphaproteobacteria bacterium]